MFQLLGIFFPSIALIVLGFYLKRTKVLELNFWDGAEKLNYYILFPSLLFLSLAKANTQISQMSTVLGIIFVLMFLLTTTVYLVAWIRHTPVARIGVYVQSLLRFNTYIGLSIATTLNNPEVKSLLINILAIAIPAVNVISILSLTPRQQLNLKNIFISLIKNPLISSCLLGMTVNYLDIPIWSGFESVLNIFSSSSLMLGLLCVGAAIQIREIRQHLVRALNMSVLRLVVLPTLVFAITYAMGLGHAETMALLIFFAIPTASSAYVLTKILRGDHSLMAGVIGLQTALSAITLPLLLSFLMQYLL
ncbi:AEC family transporter [Acinetobacter rudis]|uniref:AEC family transporter n=1 Tax=Acinetobacter rudis TaxID=632955 RepID=UPI00333E5B25